MESADSSLPPPPLPLYTPEQDPAPALRSEAQSQERVSANAVMVVDGNLGGLDRKKEEMHKIFEHIHETASSVLEFSLRWEEIDEQFDFEGGILKQRAMEVELKEVSVSKQILELEKKEERLRLVEERERKIEASITERLSALKEKEIESDLKLILEGNVMRLVLQMQNEQVVVSQLNAQEKMLGLLQGSMMKKHDEVMRELETRKDEVVLLSKSIDDELKEFDLMQEAETDRRRKETELVEISLKQLEGRENEFSLLYNTMKEKSTELEKKEKNFELRQHAEAREIEVKRQFLDLKEKKLEVREKELELKQRKLEELSIHAETFKRSRLEFEPSVLEEKVRDAESFIRPGKKQKLITEHNHNVEEKCVLHGKISSESAPEYEHTSEVKKREADIDEVDEDPKPFVCPDSDFNEFNNTIRSFAVDQVWALYDPIDDMPRYYARIKEVLIPQLSLCVEWLDSVQTTENEDPIPSCGRFEYGKSENKSYLMFSHEMHHITLGKYVTINPRKGETWALFRDWTKTWNSCRGQQKLPYRYDFVEILSEFDNDQGTGVAYLGRVDGFTSVYKRAAQHGVVALMISSNEMSKFSHRVPSLKLNGDEKEGVPAGSFELDPAGVPQACLQAAKV